MPSRHIITGLTRNEIREFLDPSHIPEYRIAQIWNWLYVKRVNHWDDMSNLPAKLRRSLSDLFLLRPGTVQAKSGDEGNTRKLLLRLSDGELVEEVLIPAERRKTVCISTQAGCSHHCAFCASGLSGFRRNLLAGEIVGQVLAAADEYGDKPSHVVFMGIGEPFDNYEAVLKTILILNDPDGLNIGARKMTISTCGITPGIRRLAEEGLQVELSVSLHAPDDELRSRLMPINKKYSLLELMSACKDYTAITGRIITFEYTLISGMNDSSRHAIALTRLLSGFKSRVNLIPLSPVTEFDGSPPDKKTAYSFMDILNAHHINTTLRISRGNSLNAACGQLRARHPEVAKRKTAPQ